MRKLSVLIPVLCSTIAHAAHADGAKVNVTLDTYIRAESDYMLQSSVAAFGAGIQELVHARVPTTPENQPVIRMNQDTLYSGVLLDLSEPVEITMPDVGDRYMSMHVVNQDHYMFVEHEPGTHLLTEERVGTRHALVTFRTFVDVNDPDDVAVVHGIQNAIAVTGGGKGPYEGPDWDLDELGKARQALSDLAELGFSSYYAFGTEGGDTRPIDHLVGTAAGWGGLPRTAALYRIASVEANDGATPHAVTVKDVPVDAFWSITHWRPSRGPITTRSTLSLW